MVTIDAAADGTKRKLRFTIYDKDWKGSWSPTPANGAEVKMRLPAAGVYGARARDVDSGSVGRWSGVEHDTDMSHQDGGRRRRASIERRMTLPSEPQ